MTLSAIIFDVDGTLAETEQAHLKAFNEAFAAAGLDWRWDEALYGRLLRTTGGKERMAHYMRETLGQTPDMARIADLHAAKTAAYVRILEEGGLTLRPGIGALIADARARGLRLAVATTTSRPNVDALCRCCFGAESAEVFDVIAAGDEVKAKKPAPDVYLLALARLGLSAASCIALEDSAMGVDAATAAGLRCVAAPSRWTAHHDLSPAIRVDSFMQTGDAPSLAHLFGVDCPMGPAAAAL